MNLSQPTEMEVEERLQPALDFSHSPNGTKVCGHVLRPWMLAGVTRTKVGFMIAMQCKNRYQLGIIEFHLNAGAVNLELHHETMRRYDSEHGFDL
jgi:hypothetical protein